MITAAMVKELRERTGAAMMDCKRALQATDGDLDAAAEKMRMEGQAKADKKASRVAADGTVAFAENDQAVAVLEVNCETDFVAKGDDFLALANAAAEAVLTQQPADVAALAELSSQGRKLDEWRRELVNKIGENMTFRRFSIINKAGGATATYSHGGRIGTVVTMDGGDEELARNLAMHVAASNPQYLDADAVPAEAREAERKILIAQAEDSGKPMEIIEKMVEGRLRKYLAEITLLGQPFVMDPDQTVEKLLKGKGAKIAAYARFEVGEGIEKAEDDFAAEVAATAKASMS